jgi:hypothetical protein
MINAAAAPTTPNLNNKSLPPSIKTQKTPPQRGYQIQKNQPNQPQSRYIRIPKTSNFAAVKFHHQQFVDL